ncbi:MAG: universal stress protein [Pseudanabaenaceae cyanobacterium]
MFPTILFAVDSSLEARQAVPIVVGLVKTFHSRLLLLSVVDPEEDEREKVEQLLENARQLFEAEGIAAETKVGEGKPAFVICDVADELNCDLIIMGTRGVTETSESVSQRVITLSPCPVLVVP